MIKEGRFVLKIGEQCVLLEGARIIANSNDEVLRYMSNLDFSPPSHLYEEDIEDLQRIFKFILDNGCCINGDI